MSSTRPPGEGSGPRSAVPTPASTRDARTQGPLRGVESILAASSGAGSSSGAALAGRASPAEVHPDLSNPVDRLFKVSRNHPLEALYAGIEALTALIEGDESKRQGLQLSDLKTIRDFLRVMVDAEADRPHQPMDPLSALRAASLSAGIFNTPNMDASLELLQIADFAAIAAGEETTAQPFIEAIAGVLRPLVSSNEMHHPHVIAALRQPNDQFLYDIYDTIERFRDEKGARFRAQQTLRSMIGYCGRALGSSDIRTFEKTFGQVTPSFLLAALQEAASNSFTSNDLNAIANKWGSGELIAAAAERGLTPGQSPQVMTDLLLRLGIIEPAEEALLRGEADEVAAIVDILMDGISLAAQESAGGAPLPALVMRHIVLEHTLLLLRRVLAEQAKRTSPETGHPG